MKKVLLLVGLAAGAFLLLGNQDVLASNPIDQDQDAGSLEGRIVINSAGAWFVVRDGKLYSTTTLKSLQDYQAAFPEFADAITVSEAQLEGYRYAGTLGENVQFIPRGARA